MGSAPYFLFQIGCRFSARSRLGFADLEAGISFSVKEGDGLGFLVLIPRSIYHTFIFHSVMHSSFYI